VAPRKTGIIHSEWESIGWTIEPSAILRVTSASVVLMLKYISNEPSAVRAPAKNQSPILTPRKTSLIAVLLPAPWTRSGGCALGDRCGGGLPLLLPGDPILDQKTDAVEERGNRQCDDEPVADRSDR
jgi:hypothetical protein